MRKWLTWLFKSETPPEAAQPSVAKRVVRLEIELEELRALVEATWARQRKVEGAVHGMRGASRRHPQRDSVDETLEEFRERMIREGRMRAHHGESEHGDH